MNSPAAADVRTGGALWWRLKSGILRRSVRRSKKITSRLNARLLEAALSENGVGHASRIPTWTTPAELRTLFELASSRRRGGIVLEIGSYLGASSCFLGAGIQRRGGRLFCVDTWENQTMPEGEHDTFAEFVGNIGPLGDVITIVRKRSDHLQAKDVVVPVDMAFIDGDHSFEAVARDFATVAPWIPPLGIVAFHDVGAVDHPGVSQVVGAAIASGRWVPEGAVDSLVWLRKAPHADLQAAEKVG